MKRYNPRFPIGRGKLEALAVICCASIMSVASLEVVQFSALDLYNGWAKGGRATPQRHTGSGVPWSPAGRGCVWMGRLLTKPGRAGRVSSRLHPCWQSGAQCSCPCVPGRHAEGQKCGGVE